MPVSCDLNQQVLDWWTLLLPPPPLLLPVSSKELIRGLGGGFWRQLLAVRQANRKQSRRRRRRVVERLSSDHTDNDNEQSIELWPLTLSVGLSLNSAPSFSDCRKESASVFFHSISLYLCLSLAMNERGRSMPGNIHRDR